MGKVDSISNLFENDPCKGKYIYSSGAIYEGEFKEDFFDGEGSKKLRQASFPHRNIHFR